MLHDRKVGRLGGNDFSIGRLLYILFRVNSLATEQSPIRQEFADLYPPINRFNFAGIEILLSPEINHQR